MRAFSEQTIAALKTAGWYAGRHIPVEPFIKEIEFQGCTAFAKVVEFLARFGGLHVPLERLPMTSQPGYIILEPRQIRGALDVDYFRSCLGKEVAPIGEAYHILWMTEEGKVYLSFDEEFCHFGATGEDAIEAIVSGRPPGPAFAPYPRSK